MRDRAAVAALLVLAAAGCARCGRPAAVPPERLLPADVAQALVLPRLRSAQEQAASLVRAAQAFPAAAGLAGAIAGVQAQLGFDPLDPEAARAAGLDPERGLALAVAPDGGRILVLPLGDEAALTATVGRLARERLGADRREVARQAGTEIAVFRASGRPSALALLVARGHALLAAGAQGPARLAALAGVPEAGSLDRSAPYRRARAALGPDPAAVLFAPPRSPALASWAPLREGAALGLSAGPRRLAAAAAILLGAERSAAWRAAVGPAGPPADEVALPPCPADAFVAARLSGDPAPALRRALAAAPGVEAALARAGLEPERDLLAALAPGAVASLSLAPTFEVAAVSRGRERAAARDPFRLVHLSAALAARDEAQARAALARLARAAPALGLSASAVTVAGRRAWRLSRGALALDVAVDGRRVLVGGGAGTLAALLAGAGAAYRAPTPAAAAALQVGTSGAVLDFGRLVTSFRALPPSAYGSGPDAFVMRSLAERVIDPASRLSAGSVRAAATAEAARLDLLLELRSPETAP